MNNKGVFSLGEVEVFSLEKVEVRADEFLEVSFCVFFSEYQYQRIMLTLTKRRTTNQNKPLANPSFWVLGEGGLSSPLIQFRIVQ